jgi:acyl carrier protein
MSAAIAMSVADQVRAAIAAECDCDVDDVVATAELECHLGADALDLVAIAVALEERFGVSIDDEAVERWITVGDVVATLDPTAMERRVA